MSERASAQRRACCEVRYRHGGFNAIFPMNRHTVEEQAAITRYLEKQKETVHSNLSLRNNVLSFSDRLNRKSHSISQMPEVKRPMGAG